jgi:hypothetical protein
MQNTATTAKLRVRILRKLVRLWASGVFPLRACFTHRQGLLSTAQVQVTLFASIQLNVAATPEGHSNATIEK